MKKFLKVFWRKPKSWLENENAFHRACDSSLQVWVLIFLFWILVETEIHTTTESMNSGLVTISSLLFHFRCIQRCKNMQTVLTSWCLFVGASANSRHLNSPFRRFMLILTFLFTPEICHNHHNGWLFKK